MYIDPIALPDNVEIADYVIITHDHAPHYSPNDIAKISDIDTKVITSRQTPYYKYLVGPGSTYDFNDVKFEFVESYNVDKYRDTGELCHPPSRKGIGVILDFNGTRIYHAGDTDHISEMKEIRADIAMLSVTGGEWMTATEASEAVGDLCKKNNVKYAIPMHYGYSAVIGSVKVAESFTEMSPSSVIILDKMQTWYNP